MNNNYCISVWDTPWKKTSRNFNIACILLCSELIKKLGNNYTIYTTSSIKNLLSNYMKDLKYDLLLDNFKEENKNKWAMSKMYVLNNISSPVCHIDYDVFLMKPQKDVDVDIVAQNFETQFYYTDVYWPCFVGFKKDVPVDQWPEEYQHLLKNNLFFGINCGYLDIKNIDALKKWTNMALKIFGQMKSSSQVFHSCVFAEQTSLFGLYKTGQISIDVLLDEKTMYDNEDSANNGYVHVMGRKHIWKEEGCFIDKRTHKKILEYLKRHFNNTYKQIYDLADSEYRDFLNTPEKDVKLF